jgi:translocation and assembly module TamB
MHDTPAAAPAPPRRRPRRWIVVVLAAALLLLALPGGLLLALRSEGGSAWLLAQVPGLQTTGLRGRLAAGPFEAARLEYRRGDVQWVVEGLAWQDLRWRWRPQPGAWLGLTLTAAEARRVELQRGAPGAAEAVVAPNHLQLPFSVDVLGLRLGVLQIDQLPPITELRASLHLGRGEHRIDGLRFDWNRLQAHGNARLAAQAPLALVADATLNSLPGADMPWGASLQARGTLARIDVQARLRSGAPGGPALDIDGRVTPFAAWPLAALHASTQDLDLAALARGLPSTRLSGDAQFNGSSLDAPLQAEVRLHNRLPGPWDRARLPVERLALTLRGQPRALDTLELQQFELLFADERAQPVGRLSGRGRWQRDTLLLDTELSGLRPEHLDGRLAPMTLGGPLALKLFGLPSPDGSPATAVQRGELRADLQGRSDAQGANTPPPTRIGLQLDARREGTAWQLDLREFGARAGEARADLTATFESTVPGTWRLRSRGELSAFDPAPWWAGADPALWRVGQNRLNARWNADVSSGAAARTDLPPIERLRLLRGEARLDVRDSQLAGVPLQAELLLRGAARSELAATLQAGDNRLVLSGQGGAQAGADRWHAELQAPALAALAPLARLHPALAGAQSLQGSLSGQASASGRWPALRTEGTLQALGLHWGDARAASATARWQAGSQADAPLSLQLEGEGLALGTPQVDHLQAALEGTWRSHRLTLDASSPLRPPGWAEPLLGGADTGSALRLRAEGGWQPAERLWQGRVLELQGRARGGDGAAWLTAGNLAGAVRFDADGRLQQASAEPGRIGLLGATLRWSEAHWQAAADSAGARIALDAELEPLPVAPLLARLQPGFGWGGDLQLGGRFVVRSAERFEADLVLERHAGDLSLTEQGLTQALGLTDLRLALAAEDGTWHFTQVVAGANLGVLSGAQSLRLSPQASWPPADTPLEGVLEWHLDNLGVLTPWVPPTWRLAGTLRTSAALSGRFGAPEYTGRMFGSGLAVRNLLEGVDLRDGELAISLRGADAKIERFVFKAGDGELNVAGGASLGSAPSAQLRLEAQRFQLLGRFDRRLVASGQADVALQSDRLKLDGRFTLDEGLIDVSHADAPGLDSDVAVLRRAELPSAAPEARGSATAGPLRDAQVNLQVDLGERLRLRGRGLDTLLRGRLALTTPGGRVAVNGTLRTAEGTYAAYGQKLTIERGVLAFSGPVENPRLDIVAIRPNLDVQVGVSVAGTVAIPRIRLFSEPEMSDMDKLSWLMLGRASDGLGGADTALLQRAALALLAGEGESQTDAVLRNLGLDELSVRQDETGTVRETVVSLGKQLSQRWYVGYERGVNATAGTWQLIYRIAQRFTLRAQSGFDNSLDVIWSWRWD